MVDLANRIPPSGIFDENAGSRYSWSADFNGNDFGIIPSGPSSGQHGSVDSLLEGAQVIVRDGFLHGGRVSLMNADVSDVTEFVEAALVEVFVATMPEMFAGIPFALPAAATVAIPAGTILAANPANAPNPASQLILTFDNPTTAVTKNQVVALLLTTGDMNTPSEGPDPFINVEYLL